MLLRVLQSKDLLANRQGYTGQLIQEMKKKSEKNLLSVC